MSVLRGIAGMAKIYEAETGHMPPFVGISKTDFAILRRELVEMGLEEQPGGDARLIKLGPMFVGCQEEQN